MLHAKRKLQASQRGLGATPKQVILNECFTQNTECRHHNAAQEQPQTGHFERLREAKHKFQASQLGQRVTSKHVILNECFMQNTNF